MRNVAHIVKRTGCLGRLARIILLLFPLVCAGKFSLAVDLVPVKIDVKQIQLPPLRSFRMQEPRRVELPNGMVFFLQPDDELPMIHMNFYIQGGSASEPEGKLGLVDLLASAWISGGTQAQTGEQLEGLFSSRGIVVRSDSDEERMRLELHCLSTDFDVAFKRVVDLLLHPAFREAKVSLEKQKMLTMLASVVDHPEALSAFWGRKIAFGEHHPMARTPNGKTLAAVRRADLLNWHRDHLHPNRITIAMFGSFDPAQMEATLRAQFERWERGPSYRGPTLTFTRAKPSVFYIHKENAKQSTIRLIQLGQKRDNPDYHAIRVLNRILSGPLSGRLVDSLRVKQGLSYAVSGGIGTSFLYPGQYDIALSTDGKQTVKAIQAVYHELDRLLIEPPSEEEVREAKEELIRSFVFEFESKSGILFDRVGLELWGYPSDFTIRFPEKIQKVTVDDVQRVVQTYLRPQEFSILVVGDQRSFDNPLSSLNKGPITQIDPTILVKPARNH